MKRPSVLFAALLPATLFLVSSSSVRAQDALRPLCPDRPGKGTSACTVDKDQFQLEVDAFDTTIDRADGTKTTTTVFANPQLKYGLTDHLDLEASLSPYTHVENKSHATHSSASGIGDLYLRAKTMLSDDQDAVAVAIEPFVKIPTAGKTIGNGATEGGVVLPLNVAFENNWSLGASPEIDFLKASSGSGHHAAAVYVVGLNRSFANGVSAGIELWGASDFDGVGTTNQYSFDLSAAWQPGTSNDIQFDGGVNIGLNNHTPDTQIYVGLSKRF